MNAKIEERLGVAIEVLDGDQIQLTQTNPGETPDIIALHPEEALALIPLLHQAVAEITGQGPARHRLTVNALDPSQFKSFLTARGAASRMYRMAMGDHMTLNAEEAAALCDVIPLLGDFCHASSV